MNDRKELLNAQALEVVQYVPRPWEEPKRVVRGRFVDRRLAVARQQQVERGPYPKAKVVIEEVEGGLFA